MLVLMLSKKRNQVISVVRKLCSYLTRCVLKIVHKLFINHTSIIKTHKQITQEKKKRDTLMPKRPLNIDLVQVSSPPLIPLSNCPKKEVRKEKENTENNQSLDKNIHLFLTVMKKSRERKKTQEARQQMICYLHTFPNHIYYYYQYPHHSIIYSLIGSSSVSSSPTPSYHAIFNQ